MSTVKIKSKVGRKLLAIALTAVMVLGLLPTLAPMTANAATIGTTLTLTTVSDTTHSTDGYTWDYVAGGTSTLTLNNLNLNALDGNGINFSSTVTGAVNIVLVGTNTVTGTDSGIFAESAQLLTISGSGTLNATATDTAGSGIYAKSGDITISGGTVNATGGEYGVGIYAYVQSISNITISGGIVNASGHTGIRSGRSILISGGTVNAVGSYNGTNSYQSTTINGEAILKATGGNGAMNTYSGASVFRIKGVVFENGNGTVYGDVTLPGDLTVENGETLTVPGDAILTIPSGTMLTNDGTIIGTGSILYTVTFENLTANGEANIKDTTELTLTFSADPTTLKVGNITVTGATKGVLSGTDTTRTLTISDITVAEGQDVTVAIADPAGFTITPHSQTVAIHKTQPIPDPSIASVVIDGESNIQHYFKADGSSKTLNLSVSVIGTAINKDVTWSSNNTGIASVNESGVVTFTGKEGAVIIKATSKHDTSKYDIKTITVCKNVTKIRTPLTTVNIAKGKSLTLPIELDDGNVDVTQNAEKTFISSNTKVVTVDSKTGTIKGIKPGKANITVTTANGKSLAIKVNVVNKAVKLKKFTLTGIKKNALSLNVGKTKDLKIKLTQSKASDLKVTFKSSKKGVAKVDAAGRITAVKKGTATITVKVGSKTVKVKVTVK
jgi:uncharacterized protein YjdB